jgi:hypothetical protein
MSDQFTTNKWEALGFDSHSLWGIEASDFEVIDGGNRIALTYDCVRNDIELETCPLNGAPSFISNSPQGTNAPTSTNSPTSSNGPQGGANNSPSTKSSGTASLSSLEVFGLLLLGATAVF